MFGNRNTSNSGNSGNSGNNFNSDDATHPHPRPNEDDPDKSQRGKPERSKSRRLKRTEILGVLNVILDLFTDTPKITGAATPKTDANRLLPNRSVPKPPPKVGVVSAPRDSRGPRLLWAPGAPRAPRAPRVPEKISLPEGKRRGDAMLDVLDILRTYVKYSLFDRDALRREVEYLKQMVEELGGKL